MSLRDSAQQRINQNRAQTAADDVARQKQADQRIEGFWQSQGISPRHDGYTVGNAAGDKRYGAVSQTSSYMPKDTRVHAARSGQFSTADAKAIRGGASSLFGGANTEGDLGSGTGTGGGGTGSNTPTNPQKFGQDFKPDPNDPSKELCYCTPTYGTPGQGNAGDVFNSLEECQRDCLDKQGGNQWRCFNGECVRVLDGTGQYPSEADCNNNCGFTAFEAYGTASYNAASLNCGNATFDWVKPLPAGVVAPISGNFVLDHFGQGTCPGAKRIGFNWSDSEGNSGYIVIEDLAVASAYTGTTLGFRGVS
jgi:hypothetical protein